jgi:hypothetical protein
VTETLCVSCHRPSNDQFLCNDDTENLKRWLWEMAGHASDLHHVVMTRQTSPRGTKVMVKATTGSPLPLDPGAVTALWALREKIVPIILALTQERGVRFDAVDTETAMCLWLARNVAAIALSEHALETYRDIKLAHRNVTKAVDVPPPRVWLGRCDKTVDGAWCGHDIRASPDEKIVRCPGCLTVYPVAEFRLDVLIKARSHLATAADLAAMLPAFVGKPLTRKRITYYGEAGMVRKIDHYGETRYQLGEVVDAHEAFVDMRGRRAA